jgi:hypothetical protein
MKSIILIIFLLLFSIGGFAQEVEEEKVYTKKELRQIAKEEKKAQRQAEEEQMRMITKIMLDKHKFVLEADYVGDGRGSRIPVSSTINFIAIDSSSATIQLGTTYGVGYNGVGGITVDGRITKYELTVIEGKRGTSYSLIFMVMTAIGGYDITLHISDIGYTDATIRGNTMGKLSYTGNLVPIGVSRVYKGTPIF